MEPFKITCVTCQAGLAVRNESLLGQIVACPRCGSMVEVNDPKAAASPDAVSPAVAAVVESPTAQATSPASKSFETIDESTFVAESPIAESPVAGNPGTENPVTEATPPPVASNVALQANMALTKYKLLVWALAGCFVGAAVLGVVLLKNSGSLAEATPLDPNEVETVDDVPLVGSAPATTNLPTVDEPTDNKPTDEEPTDEEPTDDEPVLDAPVIVEAPEVAAVREKKTSAITRGISELEASKSSPLIVEALTPESSPEELPPSTQESVPQVARRFDPLEFDPERMTLDSFDQPTEQPVGQPAAQAVTETEYPAEVPVAEPKVFVEEVPVTTPLVRRGPSEGDAVSGRDASKQLSLVIPSVKFKEIPLVDCLRLFSQLSGLPISIAPEQLLMAGITPERKVSIDVRESSLEEMLKQVFDPLRLECEAHGAQVVVQRQEAKKVREIGYPIGDLVDSADGEQELASWVQQFIAPETWQTVGGSGTLEVASGKLLVKQTQQVQYQVLVMLERLRLARNLPQKSRFPVKRLAGTPANQLLENKLAKSATFMFSQFASLNDVFAHWQTELGVPLLIDWPALSEADLWPKSTIACSIHDQPWSVAMEKVLEPLGLGWRATPGGAIEITTSLKVHNELLFEIYVVPVDTKIDRAEIVGEIQSSANLTQAAQTAIVYDSKAHVLMVLQSAAGQRTVWGWLWGKGFVGR